MIGEQRSLRRRYRRGCTRWQSTQLKIPHARKAAWRKRDNLRSADRA